MDEVGRRGVVSLRLGEGEKTQRKTMQSYVLAELPEPAVHRQDGGEGEGRERNKKSRLPLKRGRVCKCPGILLECGF